MPVIALTQGMGSLAQDIAEQLAARLENRDADPFSLQVPTVAEGVRGVRFIEAAVRSSQRKATWVPL